jgi:hypothetical protein
LVSAIEDLSFAEEQIIEDEVTEILSQQNTMDLMIDATISSTLEKHAHQTTRVLPMPQFWASDEEDNLVERCL